MKFLLKERRRFNYFILFSLFLIELLSIALVRSHFDLLNKFPN